MLLKPMVHLCMGLAYRVSCSWVRLRGQPLQGVAVAIWHAGELLVVQHSYRPGYSLPGGLIKKREDPNEAACRELREEVGIVIRPDELILISDERIGRFDDYIFEYRPVERPQIEIDNWEIVEAQFVDPGVIPDKDSSVEGYLRRIGAASRARPVLQS